MKQIDERGNACPIPVVHTKKALEYISKNVYKLERLGGR